MKTAIMQPYFMPYLGYWQLMNAVDQFVIYDNIQFTKKGWIHRNRFLQNGNDALFSVSLKKDSDFKSINQRFLVESNDKNIEKIIRQFENSYRKAPYFKEVMPLIMNTLKFHDKNLFNFLLFSISQIKEYIGIRTPLVISSSLNYDNELKSQDKVLDICRVCQTDIYINAIGGIDLYDKLHFSKKGIELKFIKMGEVNYQQFDDVFVPNLSIIDVLMFNSPSETFKLLNNYIFV